MQQCYSHFQHVYSEQYKLCQIELTNQIIKLFVLLFYTRYGNADGLVDAGGDFACWRKSLSSLGKGLDEPCGRTSYKQQDQYVTEGCSACIVYRICLKNP